MLRIYKYYTLQEANDSMLEHSTPFLDLTDFKVIINSLGITKNEIEARSGVDFDDFTNTGIVNRLWNYICSKYSNNYIIREECERYDDSLTPLHQNNYDNWIRKLLTKILATYFKYKKLFTIYQEVEDRLMAQVESTQSSSSSGSNSSKNRFNDTPQVYNDDYDADKYTSEYREDESTNNNQSLSTYKSDQLTPIKRIEEIQNIYANLYEDWSGEFFKLFYSIND